LSLGKIPTNLICTTAGDLDGWKCLALKFYEAIQLIRRFRGWLKFVVSIGPQYLFIQGPLMYIQAGSCKVAFTQQVPKMWRSKPVDVESFEVVWARQIEADKTTINKNKYAVFLDGGIGDLPDRKILNLKVADNIDKYHDELKQVFGKIENDTGLPVVISLHPKSSYNEEQHQRLFGDRMILKGRSPELVKNSDLVLVHYSTAVSFAVIFKKPILFLTCDALQQHSDGHLVEISASWFNQKAINISKSTLNDGKLFEIPIVVNDVIDRYTQNFLCTTNAKRGPIWNNVIDAFEKLYPVLDKQ